MITRSYLKLVPLLVLFACQAEPLPWQLEDQPSTAALRTVAGSQAGPGSMEPAPTAVDDPDGGPVDGPIAASAGIPISAGAIEMAGGKEGEVHLVVPLERSGTRALRYIKLQPGGRVTQTEMKGEAALSNPTVAMHPVLGQPVVAGWQPDTRSIWVMVIDGEGRSALRDEVVTSEEIHQPPARLQIHFNESGVGQILMVDRAGRLSYRPFSVDPEHGRISRGRLYHYRNVKLSADQAIQYSKSPLYAHLTLSHRIGQGRRP